MVEVRHYQILQNTPTASEITNSALLPSWPSLQIFMQRITTSGKFHRNEDTAPLNSEQCCCNSWGLFRISQQMSELVLKFVFMMPPSLEKLSSNSLDVGEVKAS